MNVKGAQDLPSLRRRSTKPKGLREVANLTGQVVWTPPHGRAQAATEYARLEQERIRLEDELSTRALIQVQLSTRLQLDSMS